MSEMLDAWRRDFGLAARNLVRAPGFSAIIVATLALAIGANTAIFSVIEGVLLDPLSFPASDRLVAVRGTSPGSDLPEEFGLGGEFFVQYSETSQTLEDVAHFQEGQTTVRSENQVERLFVAGVSPSLFSTLGVEAAAGRLPTLDDEEGTVAVLSYSLWTRWFGRDPDAMGRPIEISGQQMTIIGVLGPEFLFPREQTAAWFHDVVTEPVRAGGFGLGIIGRMAPGVDRESVMQELSMLAQRLPERFGGSPQYARIIEGFQPVVRSLGEQLVGDLAGPLWVLLGTVGIVLLIACANVANLLIVRAESRQRDLAVRRALGSGRSGLIRSQMAEAILLAAAGGFGGIVLAWVAVPILGSVGPEDIPGISSIGVDRTALLFTGGVAMAAAFASGLLPAVRMSNPEMASGLRSSRRVVSGSDRLLRNSLVVVQTAAALVLLVGSGLLFQSFRALTRVDPGYSTEDIFTFQMAPDAGELGLSDGPTYAQFHRSFMDRLAQLPTVESVGLVNTLPLDEGAGSGRVATPDSEGPPEDQPLIGLTFAGGDYFQTMDIALLNGEYFERDANPSGETRAIVSRAAAERLWPGQNPIGQLLRPAGDTTAAWMSVGGVVEDVMLSDFREEAPEPLIYLPMVGPTAESWAVGTPAYVVKTPRAALIASDIRTLIQEVAPGAPMYRVFTMDQLAARSMQRLSFTMLTLGLAAGLALVLGAVGIYGTLSYVVSQRTREIGIRMALGSTAHQVRRLIVAQGGRVAVVGVGVGAVLALFATRVLDSLLFGVRSIDPVTFVAMSAVMIAVGLVASYLPAQRASSVDPIRSLRAE